MINFGKKLYKSTALPSLKLMAIIIPMVLFWNLYFQTNGDEFFQNNYSGGFKDIMQFHFRYPQELVTYILTVLIPAVYYGFIRGVRFYEKGLIINKGLPFFNLYIPYEVIAKYEIINQKHFMSISRRDTEDDYMFTVNNMDRVLAILDQNHIEGNLGGNAKNDQPAHKKLILFFFIAGIIVALLQYSGFIRNLFR